MQVLIDIEKSQDVMDGLRLLFGHLRRDQAENWLIDACASLKYSDVAHAMRIAGLERQAAERNARDGRA